MYYLCLSKAVLPYSFSTCAWMPQIRILYCFCYSCAKLFFMPFKSIFVHEVYQEHSFQLRLSFSSECVQTNFLPILSIWAFRCASPFPLPLTTLKYCAAFSTVLICRIKSNIILGHKEKCSLIRRIIYIIAGVAL